MNPTSVSELAYIELGVSNLANWQRYATAVLGLSAEMQDGTLLLKSDSSIWRIKVVDSGEDDIRCAGFRVDNDQALQTISRQLHDIGFSVNQHNMIQLSWCRYRRQCESMMTRIAM